MCYICKYPKRKGSPLRRFQEHIHHKKIPINKLQDEIENYLYENKLSGQYKAQYRREIRQYVEEVLDKENQAVNDYVPTYHMNKDGTYTLKK